MADLPSVRTKINDLEVDAGRPTSELTQQRIGSSINYLIDRFDNGDEVGFFAPGTFNYEIPDNVFYLSILAAGGGGGGGAGLDGSDRGAQGGNGAVPVYQTVKVTPGIIYNITIGAGGAGGTGNGVDGSNGQPTTFSGVQSNYVWPGALGGSGGIYANGPIIGLDVSDLTKTYIQNAGGLGTYSFGGWGEVRPSLPPGGYTLAYQNGGDSPFASGGITPTGIAADDTGGGGGAGYQSGGNGATAPNNNTLGGISAGGGGGYKDAFPGKSGGNGMMLIKPIL